MRFIGIIMRTVNFFIIGRVYCFRFGFVYCFEGGFFGSCWVKWRRVWFSS